MGSGREDCGRPALALDLPPGAAAWVHGVDEMGGYEGP